MKYLKVIVFSMAILAIGATIYYLTINKTTGNLKETIPMASQNMLQTQINSEDSIIVKVTPINLSESAETLDFEIVLDTHSGNLDQDLVANSVLIDDKGNQFSPIFWEGDPPQGHHRQGILKFEPMSQRLKLIELKLNQIGNVSERSFKWDFEVNKK
ncbi:hypothetical protein A3J17_05145 [Candidatus Curtissbacteria bacterium RIFCSPLOWO2_02_FULL_40_11]|uniref:DUF4352 domain-containing protein n=2 Tax=Candidatus Curtissiibacteriota TaxID=1752717 RepID=A0A1F5GC75_9BACT|nr:MAG: hypothetical protein A3D04_02090 [Candidatus Curtissbacteria bacterium RIFCSPHIGHO2_02_FULL_40_16b]OGE00519.1 MAG: hypothetical protein A3J17_05145 [Candidatus Curtissbacteria bacterium RIFCSPLOWO2_02_FULL_40_11]OGE13245.1 MAG: hypothetical protein A3G14_00530 [Candidatus Curtissbacteria bacterium RIFCSPLOWO2_12_FULL_38_9]